MIRTYDKEGTGVVAKDSTRRRVCLLFRVWQIWEAMVKLKEKPPCYPIRRGCWSLSPYVGDASQFCTVRISITALHL